MHIFVSLCSFEIYIWQWFCQFIKISNTRSTLPTSTWFAQLYYMYYNYINLISLCIKSFTPIFFKFRTLINNFNVNSTFLFSLSNWTPIKFIGARNTYHSNIVCWLLIKHFIVNHYLLLSVLNLAQSIPSYLYSGLIMYCNVYNW